MHKYELLAIKEDRRRQDKKCSLLILLIYMFALRPQLNPEPTMAQK